MGARLLCVLLMVSAVFAAEYKAEFQQWTRLYNKQYKTVEEFQHRYAAFKANAEYIKEFEKEPHTFKLSLNQFADLTNEEFRQLYTTTIPAPRRHPSNRTLAVTVDPPASVDWRAKGAVTAVKDQGQCGSCWSFSTTGSVEGANFLFGDKKLYSLSEQQLVDCDSSILENHACKGGLYDTAFEYVIDYGLELESDYPYTAVQGSCAYDAKKLALKANKLGGYVDTATKDETWLTNAIVQQPVSVAIDASKMSFQLYHSGVYYEPKCSTTQLDHAVLAVGYGTDSTVSPPADYYIVKNSWGTSWGQSGYIWMARNRNNNCGIATSASYPTMK